MSRRTVYSWKCDRPAAFHGTGPRPRGGGVDEAALRAAVAAHFHPGTLALSPASGQGNHLTWNAEIDGVPAFLRVEDGPEGDAHLEMESAVLGEVAACGVPVPRVLGCDASRTRVPFAWQALERVPHPDLNHWAKEGTLRADAVAFQIGRNVARWQSLQPRGFGAFDLGAWRRGAGLVGYHARYADAFRLRLPEHLDFLVARGFCEAGERAEILALIEARADGLDLGQGVLVHKDLALWNVLGTPDRVVAFIDFDDAISGDPMDDLSLLACFHPADFVERAVAGYESERPLPPAWRRRFWLHLLRNLIVKAVIRVGAGYFDRDAGFFLIGRGASGADLRRFTEERLALARRALRNDSELSVLS
jgi:aminoglycoside phosphotransferase (APT) family kinase protein